MSTKVLLEEAEIDRRIAAAIAESRGGSSAKIYGISGIGSENPIWTRTGDAAGVTLNITENENDGDLAEFVLSDPTMQAFFDFPVSVDSKGNVFVTIRPLAFKANRTVNGEIQALSVKEYEDGDEELGFELHPAFKKWTDETHFNGYGSIQIAKYFSACYNKTDDEVYEGDVGYAIENEDYDIDEFEVNSKSGLNYGLSYCSWDKGLEVIENTDSTYRMFHWLYLDLFRKLAMIYLARADVYNMLEVEFSSELDENDVEVFGGADKEYTTGNTDDIVSHSGFNRATNQIKLFNIDDALGATSLNGCYNAGNRTLYYTRLLDTNAHLSEGYLRSNLQISTSYSGEYNIISKWTCDANEPAFSWATAQLPNSAEQPEGSLENVYYACKQKVATIEDDDSARGQCYSVFSYYNSEIYPECGLFCSDWNDYFYRAWDYGNFALRLCKEPV